MNPLLDDKTAPAHCSSSRQVPQFQGETMCMYIDLLNIIYLDPHTQLFIT